MDGDFKGDFSRDSFDIARVAVGENKQILQPFAQLLMQQGRVQLDADWNGNGRSFLYYLRALAADVIGPVGGRGNSFKIEYIQNVDDDFTIGTGHYYVDGILCANDLVDKDEKVVGTISYTQQPYNSVVQDIKSLDKGMHLVYLEVWERQVTAFEDDALREVALGQGGPDTVTRAEIVWQVRLLPLNAALQQIIGGDIKGPVSMEVREKLREVLTNCLQSRQRGQLTASLAAMTPGQGPCIVAPGAKYRGEDNLLYRVEVHTGGTPLPSSATQTRQRGRKKSSVLINKSPEPTFKWSRENGSVLFSVIDTAINAGIAGDTITLTLDNLGRDGSRYTLSKDDWVEIVTPDSGLSHDPGQMFQVLSIDYSEMRVGLKAAQTISAVTSDHLLLRRWDYHGGTGSHELTIASDGAALIIEGQALNLEYGIQITFTRPDGATDGADAYRTGDYWLIPARFTTGTILWPGQEDDAPLPLSPRGITRHYAPLACIEINNNEIQRNDGDPIDLRSTFQWLTT